MLEALARGRRQLGRASQGDLPPGVQPEQVGDVAVPGVGLLVVLDPLLQATRGADLQGRQPPQRRLQLHAQGGVDPQPLGRRDRAGEQVVHDLEVHGGAVGELGALALLGDEGVLRRVGGLVTSRPRGVRHQEVEQEQRRVLHDRVGPAGEELPVTPEGVVLPQVLGQPGRAHGPDALHAVGRAWSGPRCPTGGAPPSPARRSGPWRSSGPRGRAGRCSRTAGPCSSARLVTSAGQ